MRVVAGKLVSAALATASAPPLFAVLVLAMSNRFQADDYSTAARFTYLGFFGTWTDQLTVLNGRFAGFLVTDALTLLGPRLAPLATYLVLAALAGGVFVALPPRVGGRGRRATLAAAVTAAVVVTSSAPAQTFLWLAGLGMVTVSLTFTVWSVAAARLATAATGGRRNAALAAAAIAACLASGAYETTGVVLAVASAGAIAVVGVRRRAAALAVAAVGAGSVVGVAIVAVLPGSSTRKADLARGFPFGRALEFGWESAIEYARAAPEMRAGWLAFALGLVASVPGVPVARRARWIATAGATAFVAVLGASALAGYTLGGPPPQRTAFVMVLAVSGFFFVAGASLPRWRPAIPVAIVLIAGLGLHLADPLFDRIDDRRAWATAWDRRHDQLRRAADGAEVEVPQLASGEGLDDLTADATFWVNGAAAQYYDLTSIVAAP